MSRHSQEREWKKHKKKVNWKEFYFRNFILFCCGLNSFQKKILLEAINKKSYRNIHKKTEVSHKKLVHFTTTTKEEKSSRFKSCKFFVIRKFSFHKKTSQLSILIPQITLSIEWNNLRNLLGWKLSLLFEFSKNSFSTLINYLKNSPSPPLAKSFYPFFSALFSSPIIHFHR